MAKDDGQSNQLNLTVVALVALVAIVGLVALVLNTASLAKLSDRTGISTGAQVVRAADDGITDENVLGDLRRGALDCMQVLSGCQSGAYGSAICDGGAGSYCGVGDV